MECFFTSVRLMPSLDFTCVGTYMKTRKNTPKFDDKRMKWGETRFMTCNKNILATKWKDTKEIFVI